MQMKCDLFLCEPVKASGLKLISLFDKGFRPDNGLIYSGYLFISVDRVKLVAVVSDFRRHHIPCFSVPVEYRESRISSTVAFELAQTHVTNLGKISISEQGQKPPLFWSFTLGYDNAVENKAGGIIMVDRLDGHIWTAGEYEEYMYDYNNIF